MLVSCRNFLLLKNDLHALKHVFVSVCQCVSGRVTFSFFKIAALGGPESGPNRENAIDKKLPMVTNSKLKNVQILSCKTQTSRLVDEDVSSNSVMVSE